MRRLVLIVTALVALTAGGLAVAATQSEARERPRAAAKLHRGFLTIAADYLGLTKRQLAAELRSGKSLAQVATARGKSVDGLKAALLAALKARVDAAVAAGTLDAARAERILQRGPARIDKLVNAIRPRKERGANIVVKGLRAVAAEYLGVSQRELRAQIRSGRSLAQVALASGKSVEGLEAALLVALRARVDAGVAAGTLDPTRAQRLLARAPERIHRFVTRTRT